MMVERQQRRPRPAKRARQLDLMQHRAGYIADENELGLLVENGRPRMAGCLKEIRVRISEIEEQLYTTPGR